jgi:peptidoglycan hydrolase-like protein with peptidoglycan-binding domain
MGSGLSVTGVFDADTTDAVSTYQADRSLTQTGVVDPETWTELLAGRR